MSGKNVQRAALAALLVASLGTGGCALLLVGAGAAGGYAISSDSVKNVFELPQERVYEESVAVAKEMGAIQIEDRAHGLIKAEVRDVVITITVKPLTKQTVELKVKGRNHLLMPKVDVAQEVYAKIAEHLT